MHILETRFTVVFPLLGSSSASACGAELVGGPEKRRAQRAERASRIFPAHFSVRIFRFVNLSAAGAFSAGGTTLPAFFPLLYSSLLGMGPE